MTQTEARIGSGERCSFWLFLLALSLLRCCSLYMAESVAPASVIYCAHQILVLSLAGSSLSAVCLLRRESAHLSVYSDCRLALQQHNDIYNYQHCIHMTRVESLFPSVLAEILRSAALFVQLSMPSGKSLRLLRPQD